MKHWNVLLGRRLCSSLAFSSSSSSSSTTTTINAPHLLFSISTTAGVTSLSSSTTTAMAASFSTSPPPSSNSNNVRPTLKGVIFDMDGTLTHSPSLDFTKMYERCNVPRDQDILKAIQTMSPSDAAKSQRIVDEMEEEGRQTMYLIPGAIQVALWLHYHSVPMGLVTRNTDKTVEVMMQQHWDPAVKELGVVNTPLSSSSSDSKKTHPAFDIVLSRDNNQNLPPKPHPASLEYIASQWSIDAPSRKNLIMVGDHPRHDVGFGKAAGVSTALFDFHNCGQDEKDAAEAADLYVKEIYELPALLWKYYDIDGNLGTNVPRGTLKYSTPVPKTVASQAAVQGDIEKLATLTQKELVTPDDESNDDGSVVGGNTPLIWAVDAGQLDAVDYLLQNVKNEDLPDYVNARGYIGATAFCRACQRGYVDIIKRLLETKKTESTAATEEETKEKKKSMVNVNIPNDKLQYPLHFAAFKQHREVVRILLENGADTLVLDRKGRTPAEDTSDEVIRDAILSERRKRIQM